MKKSIIASSIGVGIIACIIIYLKDKQTNIKSKNNKSKKNNKEEQPEIDSVIFDDDSNLDKKVEYAFERNSFSNYLCSNGFNIEEVSSIIETIKMIEDMIPHEYETIRKQMHDLMSSPFDLEKSMEFDNNNYILLYNSIDPYRLFIQNGFKILAFGPDYFETIMNAADSLCELKTKNKSEAASIIHDIYHIFNMFDEKDITEKTYDEYFKEIINKINKLNGDGNNE